MSHNERYVIDFNGKLYESGVAERESGIRFSPLIECYRYGGIGQQIANS